MPDGVSHGEFKRFLRKGNFTPKGERKNLYIGFIDGSLKIVTFHYHKDCDIIPTGTLSSIAKQLGISKSELVDQVKGR